jgi:hypothetical protein
VLGLETVLRSIQSLLAAKPFNLEPGFEDEPDNAQSQGYNAKVAMCPEVHNIRHHPMNEKAPKSIRDLSC